MQDQKLGLGGLPSVDGLLSFAVHVVARQADSNLAAAELRCLTWWNLSLVGEGKGRN